MVGSIWVTTNYTARLGLGSDRGWGSLPCHREQFEKVDHSGITFKVDVHVTVV